MIDDVIAGLVKAKVSRITDRVFNSLRAVAEFRPVPAANVLGEITY